MKLKAICEDGKSLIFTSVTACREFFGRQNCKSFDIEKALEQGTPLFKDNKKYFIDEDLDYELERNC